MTSNKNHLKKGFAFFLYALPLLVAGPVVTTIGFKAIKKDGNYIFFIIGFILSITAMVLLAMAVKRILQYLFNS
ncbi:MAG: DUF6095 family protein [Flavobacteriaceae bacterium]|nr:DUF6095 family protein [Flavobacteriaceae bacterium]